MDLGIRRRKTLLTVSSRGLRKGCAVTLAEEGIDITINGHDPDTLGATAEETNPRFVFQLMERIKARDSEGAGQLALEHKLALGDTLVVSLESEAAKEGEQEA